MSEPIRFELDEDLLIALCDGRFFNRQIDKLFRECLEQVYGMEGHPKADAVFNKAWEDGHSAGHHEVRLHYAELAGLVK